MKDPNKCANQRSNTHIRGASCMGYAAREADSKG